VAGEELDCADGYGSRAIIGKFLHARQRQSPLSAGTQRGSTPSRARLIHG
jgi:hypothetical protein